MLLKNVNLRVAVSSRCNMNCIYCEGSQGFRPDKPGAMEDFRKKPLNKGNITTDTLLKILKIFNSEGFEGVSLTGGEPLLNKDWDKIVKEASCIGFKRIEMTTNAMLLENYIDTHNEELPAELTKIKISLDTVDPERFKTITRGGDLKKISSVLKKINSKIPVRANNVLLKSELKDISHYIEVCEELGFKEISFLDLVYYSNRDRKEDKDFFEREFVSFPEIEEYFIKNFNVDFSNAHKYGHSLILPSGMKIIMKDSDVAVRNENCLKCPIYCQEGIYTIRIATDGTITYCPDFKAELPSIDGEYELENGSLKERVKGLATTISSAKKLDSFEHYIKKHSINLK